jgi:UDP-N-acetyl-D-mannosaminuronic acid dehydrogenase
MIVEPNISEHKKYELTDYKVAYEKADIIVMLTAHNQFKELPYDTEKIILDFCGIYKR